MKTKRNRKMEEKIIFIENNYVSRKLKREGW
jgi:hypothetical protein